MQLNGNPIDMATLTVAFASCLVRPIRRKLDSTYTGPCFTRDDAIIDFLNGTVLVPFLVLIGTAFSKEMLAMALETTKLFFAIAGGVGFIYIFREFLSSR